ncbi:MAG: ATP-binding protein [Pseudooceanicola sp.]
MTGTREGLARLSVALSPNLVVMPAIAVMLLALAVVVRHDLAAVSLAAAALTVFLIYTALSLAASRHRNRRRAATASAEEVIEQDPCATFLTSPEGEVLHANEAALRRFGRIGPGGLTTGFKDIMANPGGLLRRMRQGAITTGAASEEIVTGDGQARLTAHRIPGGDLVWRYSDVPPAAEASSSQKLALLTVGRSNSILFMNDRARHLVGGRPKTLEAVFETLPLRPGEVHELRSAKGLVQARVIELSEAGGRRELVLLPVAPEAERMETSAASVTDLMQQMPVPLLLLSHDGNVEGFNAPAEVLLGTRLQEGAKLSAVMEGLGRSINDWLSDAARGRDAVHSEFLRLNVPEHEMYVQVTLKQVRTEDNSGLLAVLSDATELKTLEAQFVQSQKMQAIGQLAGGVAHDFNNLLTAISGYCDLLLLRHDPGDPDYSDLMQINQNANRAAALVGQLLAYSRKQTLRPELLDLRDTLSDLTHLLNRLVGEKVTLSLSHDPVLRKIRVDRRQLEQVIMNLVVNARDAMPSGGEIRVETECLRLADPLNRDHAEVPPGEYVSVKVSDTGSGIPPDLLSKVFEPFVTTKRVGEGTGLGLSTAYGIVKQSGGFIFADSEPESGSCFTLMFPVHDVNTVDEPPAIVEEAPRRPRNTPRATEGVILLVEDEAPVRAFASQALRLRGFTVIEAENAEEALEKLSDESLKVDLFVTDVVMPGMDGPSWVREARKDRPDVRVVFVSGYAEDSIGESRDDVPNSTFLPKPFSLAQLTEMVQRQLH